MKIKTQWELSKLFYKSLSDPKLVADVKKGDEAVASFVRTHQKNKIWLTSPKALAKALSEYESLIKKSSSSPILYAMYCKELNSKDKEAEAMMNKLDEVYTKRGNTLLFFDLELAKVSKETQKKFCAAPELEAFRYWLKHLFANAKYNLSEPEEKILSLLSDVSFGRWVQAVENMLNTRTVLFEGKEIPLNEAQSKVSSLPKKQRHSLHTEIMQELKVVGEVAESELNAIVTRKKITDEMRGFAEPYDATILGYENDRASVLALVETVTKHFTISQRFYKLKAKLLKEKTLTYADRSAHIGTVTKKITFADAAAIVGNAFRKLDPEYAEIFERLLANGQVDVYPTLGKSGGAYCSHGVAQPTLLLLNHIENAQSLLTLAHEMGHAVHSERSKTQPPMYEHYSTVTAETASTFFERAAFESLVATLSEKERLVAMHDRLQDDISTVFRQIAFFNFECELHKTIRAQGLMTKEAIAALMNKHVDAYLGSAVKLVPDDGYFFVAISHIRRFFYVYSYAYGLLVSRALYERVKKDPAFIKKVDAFLCAGGSDSPEGIFAKCGFNLYKPDIFLEGLKGIEKELTELEKLVAKQSRKR